MIFELVSLFALGFVILRFSLTDKIAENHVFRPFRSDNRYARIVRKVFPSGAGIALFIENVQFEEIIEKSGMFADINFAHDFYEVDYLPENDRVRYTISPAARKEVLKRLLELNHKLHAEEVAAGLWDKKKGGAAKKGVTSATPKKDEAQGGLFG